MANELASSKLPPQEADEFRSDINRLLKEQQQHHNNCNLNPAQCRALTQLKQDSTRVVLTVDKGVAMVIMDQQDYNTKAQALLQDTNTYKVLPQRPHPYTQKQAHQSSQRHQAVRRPQDPKVQTTLVQFIPNFMAFPKYTKQVPPSDPQFPVGGQSHMG